MNDVGRDGPHLYPSHWITQRCVSMEFLEYIVDLDIKIRAGGVVQRSQGFTMAGVSLIEAASSFAFCCCKVSSLHFSRVALSFISSHQLGLSLI